MSRSSKPADHLKLMSSAHVIVESSTPNETNSSIVEIWFC